MLVASLTLPETKTSALLDESGGSSISFSAIEIPVELSSLALAAISARSSRTFSSGAISAAASSEAALRSEACLSQRRCFEGPFLLEGTY